MKSISTAFIEYWRHCSDYRREEFISNVGWLNICASTVGFIIFQIFCRCVLTEPLFTQFVGGFIFFLISVVGIAMVLLDEFIAGVITKMCS